MKILIIGSGPIKIGQAAEFDYSGTQACLSFREEGHEVVLVNSNPATIQTDEKIADIVYIEPLKSEFLEKIIEKEKVDAIYPYVGGQTALNLAMKLNKKGVLKKYNVKIIGTPIEGIEKGESREEFIKAMKEINQPVLEGESIKNIEKGLEVAEKIGYPVIVRPAFTLGGTGGGFASNPEELKKVLEKALRESATHETLIEKSVMGWEEFEYEVVRDSFGNKIIVCNMENFDPMGIHTGESIVVAPSQTLTDKEHQILREASFKIVDKLNIIGSCNVQFAVNKEEGKYYVIEVNPRLSRSSALASKATGYPIARVAAKLALGKSLHEVKNKVTETTPASFEPSLDYVVVKIPRWPFDKFPFLDRKIGTQMKSTGEVMAIGRTFEEALQKAIRSLETRPPKIDPEEIEEHLTKPTDLRLFAIFEAFRQRMSVEEIAKKTNINSWFLEKIKRIVEFENTIKENPLTPELLWEAKKMGFSDARIGELKGMNEIDVRKMRKKYGIKPTYKMVDTCAAEFESKTPYFYSTYEKENEAQPLEGKKVIIIGSGPIRIGQGIEFDYCTVHASMALKERGIKSIVINNNPETVSTDFDASSRLYFEPLTFEDVLNVIENEGNCKVLVQYGGQTSINLAVKLKGMVDIAGTSIENIDRAEDRELFRKVAEKLNIPQPPNSTAMSEEEALRIAEKIGYPVVVRPSYVIAGRAMQIIHTPEELKQYIREAVEVSEKRPVLIDKYIEDAIECEIDGISNGEEVYIGGIMEHIEFAGVHSGDANIVYPPIRLSKKEIETIIEYSKKICKELNIIGFINIQFVVKDGKVYILEVNPRASRTIPFLSKATLVPLAKIATEVMIEGKIPKLKRREKGYYVKSVVFPFNKLPGLDNSLGPEMKSTGETMGISDKFDGAYYKALLSAGLEVKVKGALVSLNDKDKKYAKKIEKMLKKLGFKIYATPGTAKYMDEAEVVYKIGKGKPDVLEIIEKNEIGLVINTPNKGGNVATDGYRIRKTTLDKGIACITEINAAMAYLKALMKPAEEVKRLNEY